MTRTGANARYGAAPAATVAAAASVLSRTDDHGSHDLIFRAGVLGVLVTIGAMSVVGMLRAVDHLRPRVGDIIAFDRQKLVSAESEPRLTVSRAGTQPVTACLLDVATMRKTDGSLIIEATVPNSVFRYRVHWAGGPTSDGNTSCGVEASVLLSEAQVTMLKMAANP